MHDRSNFSKMTHFCIAVHAMLVIILFKESKVLNTVVETHYLPSDRFPEGERKCRYAGRNVLNFRSILNV